MKKAAIYCRLSEEDKNKLCATDDSGSIQNHYCTKKGLILSNQSFYNTA